MRRWRGVTGPAAAAGAVRAAIRAVDPDLPVSKVRTMEALLDGSSANSRATALLLGTFAAMALGLAAIGIYGVISHSVGRRTHELGIRMALGAGRGDLLRLVLGEGLRLAAAGLAIGLAGAFAATRLLSALLFEVRAGDPLVFAGVAALLALVALAAVSVPAARAMRVAPIIALRHE
jgi:putative ABC transport system permease protein